MGHFLFFYTYIEIGDILRRIQVFLLNGILLTITGLIMRSIGMFFNVYLSNKIGSEAIGVYQLMMSVYLFATVLANSGIHLATTRIVSEQEAFGMEAGIKKAMKKCLTYSLVMGSFACFLLFTFAPFLTTVCLHHKISPLPLRILALSLPFLALSSSINGYFSALRKVKKTVYAQVLEEFCKITFISFFLNCFFPSGLEYACISLVLGSFISEFLSFLFLLFLFFKDKRKLTTPSFKDTNYTKQILKIALPISFTSYIRSGLSTLKQLLIPMQLEKSGLSCEKALSSYGTIHGMVMPLILFPCTFISSFSTLLIPEFSYLNAKREEQKMHFAFHKIFQYCFVFSFLIMGFFWCFAQELNRYLYPNIKIAFYIKLLSPLIVFMYLDNIVDNILKGLDKQVSVMGINIIDLVSSICLIYFLLPWQGIKGYVIVLFVSEIVNGLLSLCLLIKHTHFKINFMNWLIKPFFSIFFLNIIFSSFFTTDSFAEFLVYGGIFIFLYFVLLVLFGTFVKSKSR